MDQSKRNPPNGKLPFPNKSKKKSKMLRKKVKTSPLAQRKALLSLERSNTVSLVSLIQSPTELTALNKDLLEERLKRALTVLKKALIVLMMALRNTRKSMMDSTKLLTS